jgi:Protein of unknown function (DUF1566)
MKNLPLRGLGLALTWMGCVVASPVRAAAPAGRYAVAHFTVYDTKTKLTWEQTPSTTKYVQADAKTHCATMVLNGNANWRLPTMLELETLVDFAAQSSPAIDGNAFPNTPADWFWSSSAYTGASGWSWAVHFGDGSAMFQNATSSSYYARCVD